MKKIAENLQLGEGCVWDEIKSILYFVDIEGFKIHSYDMITEERNSFDVGDYVGAIVLDQDGNLYAGVHQTLVHIDVATGQQTPILKVFDDESLRFNDGKCDPTGRLWIGTMEIAVPSEHKDRKGKLYCIENNEVVAQYEGFSIPNGLAWDERRSLFYHIDTLTGSVFSYSFDDKGILSQKKVAVTVDKGDGHPDGMCMDEEGNLWIAMWGGAKVCCYDPLTGMKMREVTLPDSHTSCCTFGGDEMNQLFVTSAKEDKKLGGVHVIDMGSVRGKIANRYKLNR